jgi:hypothetical protein
MNDESQKLRMLYNFESVQACRLEIVDVDKTHNAETVDFKHCVSANFWLAEVLQA